MATDRVNICSVCTDEYDDRHHQSVSLPCGHDFCLSCLVRLRVKGKHKCPRCRRNWALIALSIPSGMEALATALESDQDDEEEYVGKKKDTDDRCKKHSSPYDFWVNAKKEFYCRKCAAEDKSGVVLDVVEEAIPQIKAALAFEVTEAKMRLGENLESLDEKHANLVKKRNGVRKFSNAVKALVDNFDQEIEQVAAERTETLNSSVEMKKVEKTITSITSPADLGVAMECKNTLKRVGAPSRVPASDLHQTLLSRIACSYEGLEGLSADDDFLTRLSSELEKSSPNHETEAQASEEGLASAKSISKTISEKPNLVSVVVLSEEFVRGHLIDFVGPQRSSGPGGILGHVRLFEGIGKVNKCNLCMGIDLGMANSCVAVVVNGRVDIIPNGQGKRITPSFVGFTEEEVLVGDAAKDQATWNPGNTVFDVKRLIGRKYNDPSVQKIIKELPFQTKEFDLNPGIVVEYRGKRKTYFPEEITAMILRKMKAITDDYSGMDIRDAVITVPAHFDDSQRQATVDAGAIAGLNVLNIINEPTAAAIAYGVEKKTKDRRNILVYHLGGGVQEVCVLAVENGHFQILAVNADHCLGDGDLDDRLMTHFMAEFKRKAKVDISGNAGAMAKLRKGCKTVAQNLSSSTKDRIQIPCLYQNVDLDSSITRERFENLCSDLFSGTLAPVAAVLEDAGLTKCDIDEVVLAGGSTRIPKIQQLLQECFQGKLLNKCLNPDEVFAYGAAIEAAYLAREKSQ